MKNKSVLLLLVFVFACQVFAQQEKPIIKTTSPLIMDGRLDESFWLDAVSFTNFKTIAPDYGLASSETTIVYITYDLDKLYFGLQLGF